MLLLLLPLPGLFGRCSCWGRLLLLLLLCLLVRFCLKSLQQQQWSECNKQQYTAEPQGWCCMWISTLMARSAVTACLIHGRGAFAVLQAMHACQMTRLCWQMSTYSVYFTRQEYAAAGTL